MAIDWLSIFSMKKKKKPALHDVIFIHTSFFINWCLFRPSQEDTCNSGMTQLYYKNGKKNTNMSKQYPDTSWYIDYTAKKNLWKCLDKKSWCGIVETDVL